MRYDTPWRHHVALVAVVVGGALLYAASVHRRRPETRSGRTAAWGLAGLTLVFPVGGIGVFEGVYNHGVKDALFLAGAPDALLLRLFPPPTYEMPNDLFFELSGVAQIVTAAWAAVALVRFVRAMRSRVPGA